jgi:hypothetical protein
MAWTLEWMPNLPIGCQAVATDWDFGQWQIGIIPLQRLVSDAILTVRDVSGARRQLAGFVGFRQWPKVAHDQGTHALGGWGRDGRPAGIDIA